MNIWLAEDFKGKAMSEKCKFLTTTLPNIFYNLISHITKKMDYKTPERMNSMTISSQKEKKQLAGVSCKNPSD